MADEYEYPDDEPTDSYAAACRTMIARGARWLDEHPDADAAFSEYEGVTGIVNAETPEAEEMIEAMVDAIKEEYGEPPTGGMVHMAVKHAMSAHNLGWDAYIGEVMSDPDDEAGG